jgi:hypothetical protein
MLVALQFLVVVRAGLATRGRNFGVRWINRECGIVTRGIVSHPLRITPLQRENRR